MSKTKIEWTEHSWNPVTGCTKVSPGCRNCYAERRARMLAGRSGYPEAPHHFDVTLRQDRLEQPLKRKKPTTYFVCSMSDLFHEDVPFEEIWFIWKTMRKCPQHTFQILTKRPERMAADVLMFYCEGERPLPNVWLGVSVENQATANERIPLLLQTPAAVRFVSAEPLLELILFRRRWLNPYPERFANGFNVLTGKRRYRDIERPKLDWVIVGGESGPGARPMPPDWARSIRDQCVAADVPYFHKQNGKYIPADGFNQWGTFLNGKLVDPKLVRAVQTMPGDIHSTRHMVRVSKQAAGRLLDGRTWDELPQ